MIHLRDKIHRDDIDKALEERQFDLAETLEQYNRSKNIFNIEEIRKQ